MLASAMLLGDTLTPTNMAGLLVCLVGIGLYNRSRMLELRRQARNVVELEQSDRPVQIDR